MSNTSDKKVDKDHPVIAWWSGGVTSAVACKLCLDWYGVKNVRIIFIDTYNEDIDTYRFMKHCSNVWEAEIETLHNGDYLSIQAVWRRYNSLNTATGAICSTDLKRKVREDFMKANKFSYQAFGFEVEETDRARAMKKTTQRQNRYFL